MTEQEREAFLEFVNKQFSLRFTPDTTKTKEYEEKLNEVISKIKNERFIPESWDPDIVSRRQEFRIFDYREMVVEVAGFSLVAYDWIRELKNNIIKDGKCLEIMSGSGMLSKALQDVGVDVIATDNKSWKNRGNFFTFSSWFDEGFTDVEEIDCIDAIEKYGKDVDFIIVSWAYMDDTCYRALLKMREVNPNCMMIYIGEYGEACADENFTEHAISLEDNYYEYKQGTEEKVVENLEELCSGLFKVNQLFTSWYGINDSVYLVK